MVKQIWIPYEDVVKFVANIAEKDNRDANHLQRSWWHQSSTLVSDYALPDTNIGKWTTGPHWDVVALVKTVLCQKGGTLPLTHLCNGKWGKTDQRGKTDHRLLVLYAGLYTSHLCPCLSESCRSYGGASRHGFRVIRQNVVFYKTILCERSEERKI